MITGRRTFRISFGLPARGIRRAFVAAAAVLLCFCSGGTLFARLPERGDIAVTKVTVVPHPVRPGAESSAELVLNSVMHIRDVRVSRLGDRLLVKFPEYVSKRGRVYPQVKLLTRQAADAVRSSLEAGKAREGSQDMTYRLLRLSRYGKKSRLKAFATVVFNDAVAVEVRIIEGRNGYRIGWPARKEDGRWSDQVTITDKRFRETVEQDVLFKYRSMAEEDEDTDGEPE